VLILKKEGRKYFKKPLGKLYSSLNDVDNDMFQNHFIISVGDATTKNLLDSSIIPEIGIIDNKIERRVSKHNIEYNAITLTADNPPGTITDELWDTIGEAFQIARKSNVLIVVNGEEDLAVIPSALLSDKDSIILYGQPGEGVVVVEADEIKNKVEEILSYFEMNDEPKILLNF